MNLRPTSLHLCPMSNGLMLSFSPADRRALWLASDNSCDNRAVHFFYLQGHSQQPSAFNIDRRNLDSFLEPDVGMERGRSESGSAPVKNSGQNCEFDGQESLEEMHVTDRYEESL